MLKNLILCTCVLSYAFTVSTAMAASNPATDPNQCSEAPLEIRSWPYNNIRPGYVVPACEHKKNNTVMYLGVAGGVAVLALAWTYIDRSTEPKKLSWDTQGSWSYQYSVDRGLRLLKDLNLSPNLGIRGNLEVSALGVESYFLNGQRTLDVTGLATTKIGYKVNLAKLKYNF